MFGIKIGVIEANILWSKRDDQKANNRLCAFYRPINFQNN